jgi:aminoglycoside phosphotransferase (APT) family kinase protein
VHVTLAPTVEPAGEVRLDAPPARPTLDEFVAASKLRSLVLGGSKDPNAKITILLVDPAQRRVVLAVKVPSTDQAAAVLESEAGMLTALAIRAPQLAATIPANRGAVDFHGRTGLVMSAVPGTSMMTSYLRPAHIANPAQVAGDFAAAGRWLAEFQSLTVGPREPLDMDGGVLAALERRFGADDRLGDDLAQLESVHARLARSTTPRTAVHGDFWFGNILLEGGTASGVVDWEAGAMSGEPVRDLVRFALMYSLFLDRGTRGGRRVKGHPALCAGTWGAGIEYALTGSGWFPTIVRDFLRDGLARLGAAPDCWRDAALAGVAEVAAFTDHLDFARENLELFRRLAGSIGGGSGLHTSGTRQR